MERSPNSPDAGARRESQRAGAREGARPYIGILFKCCQVYQRIYRHADGDRYVGYCPRCLSKVEVLVGEGGSSERMFSAE